MANKPNNPSLWSKAKSLAKSKFDVYPSAYANGWASKYYKSKGGTWRKGQLGLNNTGNPFGNTTNYLRPTSNVFPSAYSTSTNSNVEEEATSTPASLSRRQKRKQFENLVRSSAYPVMKTRANGEEYESRSATMNKLLATPTSESGMSLRRMRRLGQETFGAPRGETMAQYRQWYPISGIRSEQTQNSPQNANVARQRRREQRSIRRSAGPGRCAGGKCDAFEKGGIASAKSRLKQAYLNKYK